MSRSKRFHTDHAHPLVRRLEGVRASLGYSQLQMAQALGVPFRTYQKWLYQGQQPRHVAALLAQAQALLPSKRVNCWEVIRCGREPKGAKVAEEGACPAALDAEADGVNSGTKGGRVCWAISGTFCGLQAGGSEAMRFIVPFCRSLSA